MVDIIAQSFITDAQNDLEDLLPGIACVDERLTLFIADPPTYIHHLGRELTQRFQRISLRGGTGGG